MQYKVAVLVKGTRLYQFVTIFPALILLIAIVVYPLGYLVYISLTNASGFNLLSHSFHSIGIANYINQLSDPSFQRAIYNTLIFTVFSVSAQTVLGFGLALLVHPLPARIKAIATTALLVPTMIADVAVGLIWKSLLNYSTGLINYFLNVIGSPSIDWLGNAHLVMPVIIAISVWQWTPYMFLFVLAGLESVPLSYFDVLRLEGANTAQSLRYVLLPLLWPIIAVALYFRVTNSIRLFDKVFIMTGGGPGDASATISTYIQREGFSNLQYGFASAGGVIMLIIAALIGFLFLRMMYGREMT